MTVNQRLTANRPGLTGVRCVSCGAASVALSGGNECSDCERRSLQRAIAAAELRTWKRYSPGSFR